MKTKMTILFIALLAISRVASAQIVLEHTYQNVSGPDILTVIHLQAGDKYQLIDNISIKASFYNMDHSYWKETNSFPIPTGFNANVIGEYTSDHTFSSDGKICFMIQLYGANYATGTEIVNEDGQVIFTEMGFAPQSSSSSPVIFNTSNGVKMRLISADTTQRANIYSLPGTWTDISTPGNELGNMNGSLNTFPNPVFHSTVTIRYELPAGVNTGTIVLYNSTGQQIKEYRVDGTFSDLQISTIGLPSGNYFWKLQSGTFHTTRQMIVVK